MVLRDDSWNRLEEELTWYGSRQALKKMFMAFGASAYRDKKVLLADGGDIILNVDKADIFKDMRFLESLGVGEFKCGRRGRQSRFVSYYTFGDIYDSYHKFKTQKSAAALNDVPPEKEGSHAGASAGSENVRHSFALRPNLQVTIDLPSNITTAEAERLSTLIRAIPF